MKKNISFSIGADSISPSVLKAKEYLEKIDANLKIYGSINDDGLNWVEISKRIALDVQSGESHFGIIFC